MQDEYEIAVALYYGLLLDHLGESPDSRDRAVEWALSQRDGSGGWGDRNLNYLGLLLLERLDSAAYDDVIANIERENRNQGYELADTNNFESFLNSPIPVKLFYLKLSDQYDPDELFTAKDRQRVRRLMEMTPAFRGDADSSAPFVLPPFIDQYLAMAVLLLEDQSMTDTCRRLLLERRQANGVWGTSYINILATFALAQSGDTADDPRIQRILTYLRTRRQLSSGRIIEYRIPVWDTAYAMQALRESGVDRDDECLKRAAEWLYESRVAPLAETGDDTVLDSYPAQFDKQSGDGWGYKPYTSSDWDDTAVAIEALTPYRGTALYPEADARADIEFLFDVQNTDGSWSAWASDFSPLGRIRKWVLILAAGRDVYEILFTDQPAADVTGHALQALAVNGHTVENSERVGDAVDWLLANQESNGLWEGTWARGYAYGTSRVLLGLSAAGIDFDRQPLQRAVAALQERQHEDGSWGPDGGGVTYTAWALQALAVADRSLADPAVERGVQYLLKTQREDGSWAREKMMQNWGSMYYSVSVFTQAAALKALVRVAENSGIQYGDTE